MFPESRWMAFGLRRAKVNTNADPLGPPLPQDSGLQSLLSQERVKLQKAIQTSNLVVHSHGPFEQKPIKNFGEKGAWG